MTVYTIDDFEFKVRQERVAQDEKWGEQSHTVFIWLAILGEEFGELQKACLEWRFYEYYHRPCEVGDELVQVAAVAKAMYESLKRQGWIH
jgi:NTP pyrophosphatase (non-canonical NTP hydrolase)